MKKKKSVTIKKRECTSKNYQRKKRRKEVAVTSSTRATDVIIWYRSRSHTTTAADFNVCFLPRVIFAIFTRDFRFGVLYLNHLIISCQLKLRLH